MRHEVLGEFAAARRLVDEAVGLDPGPEAAFFALVVRADVACLTGVDLDGITVEVEARVARLPWADLTTVRQDTSTLAERALELARSRVERGGPAREVVVAPALVLRGSAGPAPY